MVTPLHRAPALLLSALLLATACDGGTALQELNRGLPSLITVAADTASFSQAAPQEVLPVEVRITDPYGDPVGGAAVVWSPLAGNGARVVPDTTRTGGDGRTSATWTLGETTGVYRLSISSPSSGATATVRAQVR